MTPRFPLQSTVSRILFSGNPVIAPRWTPGGPCSQVPDGFQEREISRLECVLSLRLSDLPALHKELGAFTIGTDQPVLLRTERIRKIALPVFTFQAVIGEDLLGRFPGSPRDRV